MSDLAIAHIWAAKSSSEESMDKIFDEQYTNQDAPLSLFAKGQKETFYDHDFLYIEDVVASDIDKSLLSSGVKPENIPAIVAEWNNKAGNEFNALVVGDEDDFSNPISCSINGTEFVYLGSFPHW